MPHNYSHCEDESKVSCDTALTKHQLAKLLGQFVVGTTPAPTQAQVSGAINSVGIKDLWEGIYSAAANNSAVLADPSSVVVAKQLALVRTANNDILTGKLAAAAAAASLGVAAVTAAPAVPGLDKALASYTAFVQAHADAVAVTLPTTAFAGTILVGAATDATSPLGVAKAARDTALLLKSTFATFFTDFKAAQPLIVAANIAVTTAEAAVQSGTANNFTAIATATAATKSLSDSLYTDATTGKLVDLETAILAHFTAVDAAHAALTATGVTATTPLNTVGKKSDGNAVAAAGTDGGYVIARTTGSIYATVWNILSGTATAIGSTPSTSTGNALFLRTAVTSALTFTISTSITLADIFAASSVSARKFVTLIADVDKAINEYVANPTLTTADITSGIAGWSVYKMMASTDIDYMCDHPNALSEFLELDQYVNVGTGACAHYAKNGKKVFGSIWEFFTAFYKINGTSDTGVRTAVVALVDAGYVNWFDAAYWGELSARMNTSKDLYAAYGAFYVGSSAFSTASIISTIAAPTACTSNATLLNFITAVAAGAGKAPTLVAQVTDLASLNSLNATAQNNTTANNQILALLQFVENVVGASSAYVLLAGASWQQYLFCNVFVDQIKNYFEPITPQTLATFLGSSVQDFSTKKYTSQVARVLSSQALNSFSPESDKFVLFYVSNALLFTAEELMSGQYNILSIITSSTETSNDFDDVFNEVLLTYSLPDRLVLLQKSCNNLSLSKILLRPSDDFMSVYNAIVMLQEKNKIVKIPMIVQSAEHGYRISSENIRILSILQFILNNLSGSLSTTSSNQLGALKYSLDQVFSSTVPVAADIIQAVKSAFELRSGRLFSKITTGRFSSVAALELNDANEFVLIKLLAEGSPGKELDVLIALESELRSSGTGANAASPAAALRFFQSLLNMDMFKIPSNLDLLLDYPGMASAFNNKSPLMILLTNISRIMGGAEMLLKYSSLSTTNQSNVRKSIALLAGAELSTFLCGYFQSSRSSADVVLALLSDDSRKQLYYIYVALKAEEKPTSVYSYSRYFSTANQGVRFSAAEIALVFLAGGVSGMEEVFAIMPSNAFAANFAQTAPTPNQAADIWFQVRSDEKWVQLLKDVGADALALAAQLRTVRKYDAKSKMVVMDDKSDAQFVFSIEMIAKVYGLDETDMLEALGMQVGEDGH